MPVGRMLLKRISDSKKLPALKTDGARLLYTWLLAHLNVEGCFSACPTVIKGKVFTRLKTTPHSIAAYLDDMEENDLIVRYEADGDVFLLVPDFVEKQPNLRSEREGKNEIPSPPEELRRNSRGGPAQVKLREGKGREVKLREVNPSLPPPDASAQKPPRVADPRIKVFIDYHFENYRKHGKGTYLVDGKKDGSLVKKMLGTLDLPTLQTLDDDLFTSEDPFIRGSGYTIGVFFAVLNKLQAARSGPPKAKYTPEEDRAHAAARRDNELANARYLERLRAEQDEGGVDVNGIPSRGGSVPQQPDKPGADHGPVADGGGDSGTTGGLSADRLQTLQGVLQRSQADERRGASDLRPARCSKLLRGLIDSGSEEGSDAEHGSGAV